MLVLHVLASVDFMVNSPAQGDRTKFDGGKCTDLKRMHRLEAKKMSMSCFSLQHKTPQCAQLSKETVGVHGRPNFTTQFELSSLDSVQQHSRILRILSFREVCNKSPT